MRIAKTSLVLWALLLAFSGERLLAAPAPKAGNKDCLKQVYQWIDQENTNIPPVLKKACLRYWGEDLDYPYPSTRGKGHIYTDSVGLLPLDPQPLEMAYSRGIPHDRKFSSSAKVPDEHLSPAMLQGFFEKDPAVLELKSWNLIPNQGHNLALANYWGERGFPVFCDLYVQQPSGWVRSLPGVASAQFYKISNGSPIFIHVTFQSLSRHVWGQVYRVDENGKLIPLSDGRLGGLWSGWKAYDMEGDGELEFVDVSKNDSPFSKEFNKKCGNDTNLMLMNVYKWDGTKLRKICTFNFLGPDPLELGESMRADRAKQRRK